jgi:predicted DNA-binding transcriptional regulator AlpA
MREILSVNEVAEILGTTPHSLRTMLSAGRDVPPSFNIGRRRVFLRRAVYAWLNRKAGVSGAGLGRSHFRSDFPSTKEQPTMSELFEVSEGDVFRDEDDGTELTIVKVYAERGYVVLNDSQREVAVSIENLLDAVKDGEYIRVEEDNEEESPEESDEDEGETEGED